MCLNPSGSAEAKHKVKATEEQGRDGEKARIRVEKKDAKRMTEDFLIQVLFIRLAHVTLLDRAPHLLFPLKFFSLYITRS